VNRADRCCRVAAASAAREAPWSLGIGLPWPAGAQAATSGFGASLRAHACHFSVPLVAASEVPPSEKDQFVARLRADYRAEFDALFLERHTGLGACLLRDEADLCRGAVLVC
jgi:hypothetical protein